MQVPASPEVSAARDANCGSRPLAVSESRHERGRTFVCVVGGRYPRADWEPDTKGDRHGRQTSRPHPPRPRRRRRAATQITQPGRTLAQEALRRRQEETLSGGWAAWTGVAALVLILWERLSRRFTWFMLCRTLPYVATRPRTGYADVVNTGYIVGNTGLSAPYSGLALLSVGMRRA